ncbi:Vps62-related protein [Thermoplasmatota archaeon]
MVFIKNKIVIITLVITCFFSFGNFIDNASADEEDIALQYAPIYYFEKDETCYPVDVSYHLSNSNLYQIDVVNPIIQSPSAEDISNYKDNSYYLDNQRGTIEDDGIINDYKIRNLGYTIYSNVIYSGDLTYIQYWMFYAFNKGTLNQHEGDWEMVQILISSGTPTQVMYSQHHSGQKATWNQVDREGDHIKVYISRGSHANYLRSYSGVIGIANDIVGANGKKLTYSDYDLVLLESQPWLEYKGRWGWSGSTEEEFQEANILGQTGPYGPQYRKNGDMWSAIGWGSTLPPANDAIFIMELLLYNFVTIFIIITLIIICILAYRIYKRNELTGLGPRILSILYIDGLNTKSIGNILCIMGIIIAIISLFNPWYLISTDMTIHGYETSGLVNILSIDGITGIQLQFPGITGPMPLGSIMIPFSLLIGIGILFLIFTSVGLSKSKKLGNKYLFRGIRLLIPIIFILLFIIGLRLIPFESLANTGDTGMDISEVISSISNSPINGNKFITIQDVEGQIQLNWGLGFGGFLLLFSGIILIIAGIIERVADVEFFQEKIISESKKEKKSDKKEED